jgi:anti-sigma-K factor RskA
MSAAHERFEELAAAYALGALDGEDAAHFQAHVAAGCADCGRAVIDYREALVPVAEDFGEPPPERVRETLLERVRRAGGGRASRLRIEHLGAALVRAATLALAAGLAAVVSGAYVGSLYKARLEQVAREEVELRQQLAEQMRAVAGLRGQLAEQERTLTLVRAQSAGHDRTLALLSDPATRVVTLGGLGPTPRARGRMVWNARAGGLLVAVDLPSAPEGKTYELWAITGGTPRPAGLFNVDRDGKASLTVPPLEGAHTVDVFAVTLEEAGGVDAPRGQMYLSSKEA